MEAKVSLAMTTSLSAAWQQVGRPRLLVIGDFLLDRTTWGNAERISPEAPVLVLRADRRESHAGGAGSVATMLRALEADVAVCGACGDDETGAELRHCLAEAGVPTAGISTSAGRSTPLTDRLIGRAAQRHAHQILRIDEAHATPLDEAAEALLIARIEASLPECQSPADVRLRPRRTARRGCRVRQSRPAQRHGCPVLIDPGETRDYSDYRGCGTGHAQSAASRGGQRHRDSSTQTGLAGRLLPVRSVRAGGRGHQAGSRRPGSGHCRWSGAARAHAAREVYDVTGARDMVLAMFGLCLAGGLPLEQAAPLANLAAGLKLEKFGAASITPGRGPGRADKARRRASLESWSRWSRWPAWRKPIAGKGRKVVFTNGCFDLLHVGHVTYLQQAAAPGRRARRGHQQRRQRAGLERSAAADLPGAACAPPCWRRWVAWTTCSIFDDPTPHALLWAIRPDVLVKGGTYTPDEVVGREVVQAYGGHVCVAGMVEGISTTAIVGAVRRREPQCRLG